METLQKNSVYLDGLLREEAEFQKQKATEMMLSPKNFTKNGEVFASNSGIFSQGFELTTVSQAIDILEVRKASDEKFNMLVNEIRAFIIRIYCTLKDNASRY